MNEHFVSVKVDREERPDVDALYMEAVQAISGQGGWPMTVFCDPDGVPFYGGTYFPPDESRGMPSFRMVMEAVVDAFEGRREELRERAAETRARLGAIGAIEPAAEAPGRRAAGGGAGDAATARPTPSTAASAAPRSSRPPRRWSCCSPAARREHVERTLDAMMAGGIYDQVGGGFSRYSVDAAWLVPHFEKMLYDNALLARAYLHGWQALGHERYRRVCEETLDWALREMRGPEGGFYSALDADSEGEEGRFYVWTPEQIRAVLGRRRRGGRSTSTASARPATSRARNILHLRRRRAAPEPAGLAEARRALYEARAERVRPGLDDKRLTAWNALMLAALAEAGAALGREDYLDAAARVRRVRPARPARRRRPPAAHLQGRRGPAQRLPRGPRLPAGSAADAVRSELRAALVRAGRALADDHDRPLRRPRARRLLLDLRRPRAADRPPQGDRRPPDPLRQLAPPRSACCASSADRRARLRAAGRRGPAPLRQGRAEAGPTPSPTCCGARLPARARPRRSRARRRRPRRAGHGRTLRLPPDVVLAGGPGAGRPAPAQGSDDPGRPAHGIRLRELQLSSSPSRRPQLGR